MILVAIGIKIGKLTILEILPGKKVKSICDCGNTQRSAIKNIESGVVDRCRKCLYKKVDINGHKDLVGKKFGEWEVLKKIATDGSKRTKFLCRCSCGTETIVLSSHLLQGASTRCITCGKTKKGKDNGNFTGHEDISGGWWANHIMKSTTKSSKRNKLEISISMEFAWNLFIKQDRKCNLTGLPLVISNSRQLNTASLDRIDSSIGYVENNVQWLHKHINMLKNIYDQNYFIEMCILIANHHKKINQ